MFVFASAGSSWPIRVEYGCGGWQDVRNGQVLLECGLKISVVAKHSLLIHCLVHTHTQAANCRCMLTRIFGTGHHWGQVSINQGGGGGGADHPNLQASTMSPQWAAVSLRCPIGGGG